MTRRALAIAALLVAVALPHAVQAKVPDSTHGAAYEQYAPGDSDGDGVSDDRDAFPYDDSRYMKPATSGDDTITGIGNSEWICGLGGDDVLSGLAGNDTLWGDGCAVKAKFALGAAKKEKPKGGNDKLKGGRGQDRLFGGPGDDLLEGGIGNDLLYGGSGKDRYKAGPGNDHIKAVDGRSEKIDCGAGTKDRATVDPGDRVEGCEKVTRQQNQ